LDGEREGELLLYNKRNDSYINTSKAYFLFKTLYIINKNGVNGTAIGMEYNLILFSPNYSLINFFSIFSYSLADL